MAIKSFSNIAVIKKDLKKVEVIMSLDAVIKWKDRFENLSEKCRQLGLTSV